MVVVLTIEKFSNLVVGLFDDWCASFHICVCDTFFGCGICFNSTTAKRPTVFPKVTELTVIGYY